MLQWAAQALVMAVVMVVVRDVAPHVLVPVNTAVQVVVLHVQAAVVTMHAKAWVKTNHKSFIGIKTIFKLF